jgi:hypothetical protein
MREPSGSQVETAECEFDYSSRAAQTGLDATLDAILVIRTQLRDPNAAGRVGATVRRYERSLGLAVVPTLLWRALAGRSRPPSPAQSPSTPDVLISEIKEELERGTSSPKVRLYERSLGTAVIPVLLRRAAYKLRRRQSGLVSR